MTSFWVKWAGCLILCLWGVINFRCKEAPGIVVSTPVFIEPAYNNNIRLVYEGDSLHFPLSENTYNEIKSFNYFTQNGSPFLSFYDRRSESICIYNFLTQKRVKKIRLKRIFKDQKLFKVSAFAQNFDSIFVTNQYELYLLDSSRTIKKSISFFEKVGAMAVFEKGVPVVTKNNKVYMGVRPYVNETSFSAIRQWRVLYEFDFADQSKKLYYPLPEIYQKSLYGDRFFDYSYCYNDKGNFVFSFPADSCIYETNLSDYHKAYYGKSRFQAAPITPVARLDVLNDEEKSMQYLIRDAYGRIYYDSYRKRYFRVIRHGVREANYRPNEFQKKESLIVFDENFRIIGEFEWDNDFSLSSLFFTKDGGIYARTRTSDEYALHFVRLTYLEKPDETKQLAKNK